MQQIDDMIEHLIDREGGFVDHPADKGGPTIWGIAEAVARRQGYMGPMALLQRSVAVTIYKQLYWQAPGFDRLHQIAPKVAEELFDTGVNMGTATAIGSLQRALNALNRNGRDYSDITVDRKIGLITLRAVQAFLQKRGTLGEHVLTKAIDALQGAYYVRLAEARPAQEAFLYGWLTKRIG
ncbi:glycoside hydrolase family 108 protein [Sphingorhabdus sp.]|uniref:glycoside hydrolase family 108 protein n=1 Tax=Sphingorhabdus sp. TaxID=1902408 RepID=UPI00398374DE